jgi:hypothetical protein
VTTPQADDADIFGGAQDPDCSGSGAACELRDLVLTQPGCLPPSPSPRRTPGSSPHPGLRKVAGRSSTSGTGCGVRSRATKQHAVLAGDSDTHGYPPRSQSPPGLRTPRAGVSGVRAHAGIRRRLRQAHRTHRRTTGRAPGRGTADVYAITASGRPGSRCRQPGRWRKPPQRSVPSSARGVCVGSAPGHVHPGPA